SPVMAALPVPASQAAGAALFFREKAFWQFGRGYRLNDLRRMVRQYSALGFTVANTFPTGTFFKTGLAYGSDVNFPIVTDATPNHHVSGPKPQCGEPRRVIFCEFFDPTLIEVRRRAGCIVETH